MCKQQGAIVKMMHHSETRLLPLECLDTFVDFFIDEFMDYRLVLKCDAGILKTHAGLFIEPLLESVTVK